MAYAIGTFLFATFYGSIAGLAWAFALSKNLLNGLYYGALVGLVLGIIFYLMGKAARTGGNVTRKETTVISGSVMGVMFGVSLIVALIVWIVRLIFF